ncbi:hypothetical protein ACH5RR_038018 [Cinchona calisaya]|uniref:Wax synthase domain-containing protein n=1 Tax=Cinchona calisaya TaxID=153742 RepID=A0ABD2YBU5_9GENT
MDVEIKNFIKVWSVAIVSQFYCYFVVSRIQNGLARLLSILPIIYLFITLPFTFSLNSCHLVAVTVFYLVWLSNFKLLLFSFNKGPLSSHPPLSLPHFVAISLLPIKNKNDDSSSSHSSSNAQNGLKKSHPASQKITPEILRKRRLYKFCRFLVKLIILLLVFLSLYNYRSHLHPHFMMALYCCHMYLIVEFLLTITTLPVRALLGIEISRQFYEPYLSTSLQDFWGRRWNLVVTSILRQTIYNPIRNIFKPILGRNWSVALATLATFSISGLMHEVLYYYLLREYPTWEVTWFFVLQGICVTCEIYVKRAVAGRWRWHKAVSRLLTVGFVGVTSGWLFFPPLVRYGLDLKAIEEYYVFLSFVRNSLRFPIPLNL